MSKEMRYGVLIDNVLEDVELGVSEVELIDSVVSRLDDSTKELIDGLLWLVKIAEPVDYVAVDGYSAVLLTFYLNGVYDAFNRRGDGHLVDVYVSYKSVSDFEIVLVTDSHVE